MNFDHIPAKTVRFWAWVDSSVTWTLAIPPMALAFLRMLYRINGWLGFDASPPTFLPAQLFFVCLCGVLISVWVIARLLKPLGVFAVIDSGGRVIVSALIVYFVTATHAPPVLLLFVITEMAGAVAQIRAAVRKPV